MPIQSTISTFVPQPKPTNHKFKDLEGRIFGRLKVIAFAGIGKSKKTLWLCRCECGNEQTIRGGNLLNGGSTSCGCFHLAGLVERSTIHGCARAGKQSAEFRIWCGMIGRCTNPENHKYFAYGGRGITVCPQWINDFAAFLAHVGSRPSPKHSIDRIDNNGNYEPGNVSWSVNRKQCRNKRNNHLISFASETLCIAEWSEKTGLKSGTIRSRIRLGWSVERALTQAERNNRLPIASV